VSKWVYAARFIGVGFFVAGAILIGLAAGYWLDKLLNTRFIWIIGLLFGLFIAVWGIYKMIIPLIENDDNHRKRGG
jgi:F0F1-type ATP synthase assembly protein I